MSDDLIKRSTAIRALNREKSDWNCDYNVPIDNCIKRLNKVKSADKPQEWIPCSERVPNEYATVLVTWEYAGKFYTATAFRKTKNAVTYWASDGQPNYTPLNVVAWMPLPKPWKGAEDE